MGVALSDGRAPIVIDQSPAWMTVALFPVFLGSGYLALTDSNTTAWTLLGQPGRWLMFFLCVAGVVMLVVSLAFRYRFAGEMVVGYRDRIEFRTQPRWLLRRASTFSCAPSEVVMRRVVKERWGGDLVRFDFDVPGAESLSVTRLESMINYDARQRFDRWQRQAATMPACDDSSGSNDADP